LAGTGCASDDRAEMKINKNAKMIFDISLFPLGIIIVRLDFWRVKLNREDILKTENFMKRAIELSRKNMESGDGGPFGAVVVKDGKIIGEGWNKVTSSNDPTAHAEVVAIRNACGNLKNYDLSGCTIYSSCEPCPMCLAAVYWARIDKIYFANTKEDAAEIEFDDDLIYQEIPKHPDHRKIPMVQLLREEALEIFKIWKEKEDKIKY
jgi:guanine deaminase